MWEPVDSAEPPATPGELSRDLKVAHRYSLIIAVLGVALKKARELKIAESFRRKLKCFLRLAPLHL